MPKKTNKTVKAKDLDRAFFIHKYTHKNGLSVFLWKSSKGSYFFDAILPDEEETTYTFYSNVKSVAKSREANEKFIVNFLGVFSALR